MSRFDAAGAVIRSHPTPVPGHHPRSCCASPPAPGWWRCWAGRLWAWQESLGSGAPLALVPSFGLFCYTALLSSQVDRLPAVVSYVVGALGFVVVADRAGALRSL